MAAIPSLSLSGPQRGPTAPPSRAGLSPPPAPAGLPQRPCPHPAVPLPSPSACQLRAAFVTPDTVTAAQPCFLHGRSHCPSSASRPGPTSWPGLPAAPAPCCLPWNALSHGGASLAFLGLAWPPGSPLPTPPQPPLRVSSGRPSGDSGRNGSQCGKHASSQMAPAPPPCPVHCLCTPSPLPCHSCPCPRFMST